MNSSLHRLETWLSTNRPAFLDQLNDAASLEAIDTLRQRLPSTIPSEFCDYLAWRDGQPAGSETFYENKRLIPVRGILNAVEVLNDCKESGEPATDDWWLETWLPFVEDGGGNYLILDCATGCVHEFWKSDADRPVVADTFFGWLNGLVEMFSANDWVLERGAYVLASDSTPAEPYEKVSVVLLHAPGGGLSALKIIYDQLSLSCGIGKLLADSKAGPVTLLSGVYYLNACSLLSRVDDPTLFEIRSDEQDGIVYPLHNA